jgi:hypothetical protein
VADAALVDRRAEAREVADDAAADGRDDVAPVDARLREPAQHALGGGERLALLARGDRDRLLAGDAVVAGDVLVGDDEAAALRRVEEPGRDQAAAGEQRVVAGRRRRPHEPDARGRPQRLQRGQRAARQVAAAAGGQRRVRDACVERGAVGVELVEAAAVARERAALARRAAPRVLGRHLELDDRVVAKRVADPLGAERAAAERDHVGAATPEQRKHDLLLARAERGLAVAVEVGLERLAKLALELTVGVERLGPELGGDGAGGGRLAGAHEADEHERAAARAPALGARAACQRLHPIRSS